MTRKLAVAVVGLGFGANHARIIRDLEGAELAAVCDPDGRRLAATLEACHETRGYSDCAIMLLEERLDAVIIATPAGQHEALAMAAIESGIAALVEKPLAPDLATGERLVSAAAAAGVPLMAGHIERFNPALRELARRARAGEAGRLRHIWARRMGPIRQRRQDVNVVHDSAIHDIDAIRCVLGMEPERVYAAAQSGVFVPFEDSISAVLQFAPRDPYLAVFAGLEVNWLSPRRLRDLTILGDKGMFTLDYAAQTLEFVPASGPLSSPSIGWPATQVQEGDAQQIDIEPREQLPEEIGAFLDAVRDAKPMPVSGEDALAALAIADAITESARSGRPVRPKRPGRD
jgi:UDP-N-acetylglucosamine 3-dehydrogenase